jgi:nicotinamide-nucleotide amidase
VTRKTSTIFCIGRELLEGLVLDRNAHFMAGRCNEAGLRVATIQVLDDLESDMVAAFKGAIERKVDFVFTTGGMGPGNDDMTRACVAKAAGLELKPNPHALEMLATAYRRLFAAGVVDDQDVNEMRARMALLPVGSVPIPNLIGTAPAIRLEVGKTTFILLPGAPEEMRQIFAQHVQPILSGAGSGTYSDARHIEYPGQDESMLNQILADLGRRHHGVQGRARVQGQGEDITIRITLTAEHPNREELARMLEHAEADLRSRLGLER